MIHDKPSKHGHKVDIVKLIKILRKAERDLILPMAYVIQKDYGNDPYLNLISCLLSLRSRDTVTLPICRKLFARVKTPQQMLRIPLKELESIIHSTGFYRQKARTLVSVSRELIERFHGKVPKIEEELRSMKGVGQKTANLVLGLSYGVPGVYVDTHVHRLANQLGLVSTKTPDETQKQLKVVIPKRYWNELCNLLVTWGQQVPRKEQVSRLKNLMAEK